MSPKRKAPKPNRRRLFTVRRKLLRRHVSKAETKTSGKPKSKHKKRPSLWKIALGFALISYVTFLGIASAVATYVAIQVDSETLKRGLERSVAELSNARLEIEHLDFNILSGLEIKGLQLYPKNTVSTDEKAVLSAESIRIGYSFWKLFILQLSVHEAKVINPVVRVYNIEDKPNYLHILGRKDGVDKIGSLLSFAKFMVPLWGRVENMGLENLAVSYESPSTKPAANWRIRNVSINVFLDWILINGTGYVRLFSPESKLTSIENSDQIAAKLKMDNKLSLENLTKLKVQVRNHFEELVVYGGHFKNVPTEFMATIELGNDFQSLEIRQFDGELSDILSTKTSGKVSLSRGKANAYFIETTTKLTAHLDRAERLARALVPDLKMSGNVTLEKMLLNGVISPTQDENYSLPTMALIAQISALNVHSESLGVTIDDFNSKTEINATHSPISKGVNISVQNINSGKRVQVSLPGKNEALVSTLKELDSRIHLQMEYPNIVVPYLQAQVNIAEVNSRSKEFGEIQSNLALNSTLSSGADMATLSSSGQIVMDQLVDVYWLLQCGSQCEQLRLNTQLSAVSLGKLFGIAKPFLAKTLPSENIPSYLNGQLKLKLAANGKLPYRSLSRKKDLLTHSDLTVDANLSLNDFSTKTSILSLTTEGMDFELDVSGDSLSQIVKLSHRIPKLSAKPEGFNKAVTIADLNEQFEIINNLSERPSTSALPENFKSEVRGSVNLGSLHAPEFLPLSINGSRLAFKLNQTNLRNFSLQGLELFVPTLGLSAGNTSDVTVDREWKPVNFRSKGHLASDKDLKDAGIANIKSSGKFSLDYEISSNDMDLFNLQSLVKFDHFNVNMAKDSKTNLEIKNLHGQIPLNYKVSLQQTKASLKKSGYLSAKKLGVDKIQTPEKPRNVISEYYKEITERENRKVNMVERVDYTNIQSYYKDHNRITASKFNFNNFKTENIAVDFEIAPHEIKLKHYSMSILDGAIQGQMLAVIDILPVEIDTTLHFTGLNLGRLVDDIPELKEKARKMSVDSRKKINGTVHLNYDLNDHTMGGSIDVTSIGKDQLKLLLYYLDPEEKKPNISSLRKALAVGDLKLVKIPISNGNIGIDLDLRLLGAPIPLPKISRFPVSQIVRNFQSTAKKQTGEEK